MRKKGSKNGEKFNQYCRLNGNIVKNLQPLTDKKEEIAITDGKIILYIMPVKNRNKNSVKTKPPKIDINNVVKKIRKN